MIASVKTQSTKAALLVTLFLMIPIVAKADTVTVPVTSDTSMYEPFPDNNQGAAMFIAAGVNTGGQKIRGLLRFDLTGKVPAGATVTTVKLNLKVTFNGTTAAYNLHRMLKSWNEGTGLSAAEDPPGVGAPAKPGEVTWNNLAHPSTAWGQAGGFGAGDASADPSASATIAGPAAYSFASTATLVSDAQGWVTDPSTNFGWLLKAANETVLGTARRFGSRESETDLATLEITYTPGAAPELRITDFHLANGSASITWTGGRPNYRVERADAVTGPWTAVTTASTATTTTAPLGGTAAFYRVASQLP